MNYVLDACAMVAYVEGEGGGSVVASLLSNPKVNCYAHSINLCEFYYQAIRRSNERVAKAAIASLLADDVIERRDMSRRFWQRVGGLKSRGRISLPDCFCIALAEELGAEVVTSDHHEFDAIAQLGIVPITFIR